MVLPQLLEVPPLQVVLPPRRRPRRRKRVRSTRGRPKRWTLIYHIEKEESDEDMGFGLFD